MALETGREGRGRSQFPEGGHAASPGIPCPAAPTLSRGWQQASPKCPACLPPLPEAQGQGEWRREALEAPAEEELQPSPWEAVPKGEQHRAFQP